MNYIGTQNFETKRCFLRRIKLSDYTMMYENWAKYDEVCRYYPFNPVDDIEIYRDKVKHWISNYESDSYFHWVIEWKETGELIGTINLEMWKKHVICVIHAICCLPDFGIKAL